MNIDISKLPPNFRIEVTKQDLIAFAMVLKGPVSNILTSDVEKEDIIDFEGALQLTGYAAPTLYAKTGKGEIPHFKKGRKLFFKRSELIKWIEAGRCKTKKDLDDLAKQYLKNTKR